MSEEIKIKNFISFSEYSSFKSCEHKYYLSYVLKIREEKNEILLLGNIIHSCMEIIANDKNKSYEDIFKESFELNLKQLENDEVILNDFKLKYNEIYDKFLIIANNFDFHNRFKDYEVVEVEHRLFQYLFNYEIDWFFKGFIDLILYDKKNNCYIIIDYKTAKKKWDLKKKLREENFISQIVLYKYFYSIEKNIPFNSIKTKYYSLVYTTGEMQELDVDLSIDKINDVVLDLQQTILNIKSLNKNRLSKQRHNPQKKILCNWCNFYNTKSCNDLMFQKIKL